MNALKAAHVAAAFVLRGGRGEMSKLKLMKLMYLAERESLRRRGFPMVYDSLACLPHGPVLRGTLDLTEHKARSSNWRAMFAQESPARGPVKLVAGVTEDDLDSLSENDLDVIDAVWTEFGHLSAGWLRSYTHTLPEYREPQRGRSKALDYESVLSRGLRMDPDHVAELVEDITFHQQVTRHGMVAAE